MEGDPHSVGLRSMETQTQKRRSPRKLIDCHRHAAAMASKAKAAATAPAAPAIKVGLFGHGASGKTALAIQFVQNRFIEEYEPSCTRPFASPRRSGAPHPLPQSAMTTRSL